MWDRGLFIYLFIFCGWAGIRYGGLSIYLSMDGLGLVRLDCWFGFEARMVLNGSRVSSILRLRNMVMMMMMMMMLMMMIMNELCTNRLKRVLR